MSRTAILSTAGSRALAGFVAFALVAGSVQALTPLAKDPRVQHEFVSAAVGDVIRKNCPTISARMFRVWMKAQQLEAYAREQGYSDEDIRALRKDPEAKALLNRLRDEYLAKNGAVPGDPESYCELGRKEIAEGSLIGYLLRER